MYSQIHCERTEATGRIAAISNALKGNSHKALFLLLGERNSRNNRQCSTIKRLPLE